MKEWGRGNCGQDVVYEGRIKRKEVKTHCSRLFIILGTSVLYQCVTKRKQLEIVIVLKI